jgi:hypothetical protein
MAKSQQLRDEALDITVFGDPLLQMVETKPKNILLAKQTGVTFSENGIIAAAAHCHPSIIELLSSINH